MPCGLQPTQRRTASCIHADGTPIGNHIGGDGRTWSIISIKKGGQVSPEEDSSAGDLIHRYAKQIVGAVSAAGYSDTAFLTAPNPFKILNTFEARTAIGPVPKTEFAVRVLRLSV